MSKRFLLGLGLSGTALLAGVISVAVFVPGENVTRVLAVLGFIVALGKTAYDVWEKERERRKKKEDNVEKLRVAPTLQSHDADIETLGLRVHNAGKSAVSIHRVQLIYRRDGVEQAVTLHTHADVRRQSLRGLDTTCRLEPQEHVDFFLAVTAADAGGFVLPQQLANWPAEDFWMTIETLSGAKEIVPGEHFLKLLSRYAHAA